VFLVVTESLHLAVEPGCWGAVFHPVSAPFILGVSLEDEPWLVTPSSPVQSPLVGDLEPQVLGDRGHVSPGSVP
jgi:hypothetical protein